MILGRVVWHTLTNKLLLHLKEFMYSIRLSYFGFRCACCIHVIWTSVLQTAPKEVVHLLWRHVSQQWRK